jgi:pSer/pThr/pTyr-binding forkhead associated (FHA) protein
MSKTSQASTQPGALVKQPIRLTAIHRGQKLMDQVFQHTPIRIGRLLDNDVVLPFDFASRYHAEIRFENGQWTAVDLGSKNGLMIDATTRAPEIKLENNGTFRIQEVTILLKFETAAEVARDFGALRESPTQVASPEKLEKEQSRAREARAKNQQRDAGGHGTGQRGTSRSQPAEHDSDNGHRPMLDVTAAGLFLASHPSIASAKEKAVQMVVLWHDQVLDTREFPIGARIRWDFLGEVHDLGTVKGDKSSIKIPKGCSVVGESGPGGLNLSHANPVAFRASSTLMVAFRYVPRSKELAAASMWPEEKLLNPLILSGTLHAAAGLTAICIAPKHQVKPVEEPDRFATIIVAPTPIPTEIALQPTPTPTPVPEQIPTPTPIEVAKIEPPKPIPEKKIKKVTVEKKLRKIAEARKEDIGVKREDKPKVEKKIVEEPTKIKEETKVIAKVDEPPVKIEPVSSPAPAPTPVFEAKKVGALKMLSLLNAAPSADIANVEKIQISRAPASVSGPMNGREAINGTGSIESKLNQSAKGGGTGGGDGVQGIAVGGKSAGGSYKMGGLAGKAGTRKIRGTVVGGATYTELNKNEGLTKEQIDKVVREHANEIQACYEKSLMTNPDIVGRAEFEWEITPKGKVTYTKVKEATLKDGENLLDCVRGVFMKMKFPVAKNGESTTPTLGLPFGRL